MDSLDTSEIEDSEAISATVFFDMRFAYTTRKGFYGNHTAFNWERQLAQFANTHTCGKYIELIEP